MNTTVRMKASQITKDWHVIDAAGRPLGRVATEVATLLRGKHKPTFEPHLDGGDFVIVVNASKVALSGAKAEQRKYYRHSGYPGGLKARSYTEQHTRFPDRVIRDAVWGMLPSGPLGEQILRHLKVYAGPTHPHASQMTGSERAKAVREAAQAEALLQPRKNPRLRPLSVPDAKPEAKVEAPAAKAPAAKPKAAPAAKAPAAKAPEAEAPAAKAPAPPRKEAETAEQAAPVAEAPAAVTAAAPEAEAPAEAPKKRAPRKKAEETTAEAPAAQATTEEEAPKKPARRRTAPKQEE